MECGHSKSCSCRKQAQESRLSPSMSNRNTPRVSLELVYHILDFAQYKAANGLIQDRKSILNFALVSRSWTWHAQRLLFTNVILFTLWELQKLELALTQSPTEKAIWLQESIKSILIRVDRDGPKPSMRSIRPRAAAEVLSMCPRLKIFELELFSHTPPPLSDLERLIAAPPFEQLHIHNNSTRTGILYDWLSTLRHIKFLTMDRHDIRDAQPHHPRPPFSLYELNWTARGPVPEEFVKWILWNSKKTLQILAFDREMPSEDAFDELMQTHGSTLRSLRLAHCNEAEAFALRQCQKLEDLQIRSYPSRQLVQVLLSQNMQRLRHLSFYGTAKHISGPKSGDHGGVGDDMEDPLISIRILVEALPNLGVVTWNLALPEDDPLFLELHLLCSSRGIVLRYFYKSAFGSLPGEQEERVLPAQFPRYISLHKSRKHAYPFD